MCSGDYMTTRMMPMARVCAPTILSLSSATLLGEVLRDVALLAGLTVLNRGVSQGELTEVVANHVGL